MPFQIPPAAPLPGEAASLPTPRATEIAMLRALSRLDPAIQRWSRSEARRAMILRVWYGITAHFKTRITEWLAAAFLFQLGWTLYFPPDIFPVQPSWSVLAQLAPETTWGAAMLFISGARLLALAINGTFQKFSFSPHVRAITAFLSCGVWFQVVLSIWLSSIPGTGLGTYRIILLLECWNLWRAGLDVGNVERRRGDAT